MIEFLLKGGPLMWPLFLCSILVLGIFLDRLFYFHRATISVGELMQGLANLIRKRNFAEALHECAGAPGPVARVLHSAVIHHEAGRSELRQIVQEAGQLEMPNLERKISILATIAFVAPLMGFLGTVIGMIEIFTSLSTTGGFTSATELSSGIYMSLLTSASGLAVAIPSYIIYGYLSSRVGMLMHDMERAGIEVVNLLCEENHTGIVDFVPSSSSRVFGGDSK